MDLAVYSITKTEISKKKIPVQFTELIRPDLIAKAFFVIRANKRQPYGAHPKAGMRHSANISRRRHNYKTSYGHGISRVPRKIMSHRGERFNWVGAVAPGTVGGRRAHPPKSSKIWAIKINKKERKKAIRSALAAVLVPQIVTERGHKIPNHYPFIIENKIEDVEKTIDIKNILDKLGFKEELQRASVKKIRAGKGKLRGRKYKKRKGPLLVVSKHCKLSKAAENLPGVEVVDVKYLNAELLAPGSNMGRLTLFTEAAIDRLDKEKLFM
ncbi:MAG: 50S ribosomal protein L4 [Candidatus Woesearchaeota archaeon]